MSILTFPRVWRARRRQPPRRANSPVLMVLVATSLATVAATGCVNVQAGDGAFNMGRSIVVDEGEVAREDLVSLGGSIRVDGTARRDVVVIGGSLTVNGEVGRDVVCVGGALRLGPDARVGGNATVVGGGLSQADGSVIEGELVEVNFGWGFDNMFGWSPWAGGSWWGFSPFHVFGRTTQLIYWLLLALLTVALVGDRVSGASHAVSREPLRLGAIGVVGLIALLFAFLVLAILSIFIIGIPFLLALIFAAWLGYIFGVVAVFQSVGGPVLRTVGRAEPSQIAIVLTGGLVLSALRFVPFFGGLFWFVAMVVGFGAVFATRFGSGRPWIQRRVPASPPPAGAEAPVAERSSQEVAEEAGAEPADQSSERGPGDF